MIDNSADGASTGPPDVDGDQSLAERVAELADRISAGEAVRLDVVGPSGGAGDEILRLLPALEVMARLREPATTDGSSGPGKVEDCTDTGRALGDFQTVRVIGRGGMGIVYEAVQLSLDRRVALKTLPSLSADDPRLLERFRVEVQAAACLQHPHIVPVFAVGDAAGVPFYAMQLIQGRTFAELIATHVRSARPRTPGRAPTPDEGVPPRVVAELGLQAAAALHYAHEQGIIHRDVKPANLLVEDSGWLWVADFGLARVRGGQLSSAGDAVRGTLRYMSPEQASGERTVIDHRTDVYSLGATLYEALALRPVYDGDDRVELLHRIARHDPLPLRRHAPATPPDLETIVMKALARDPAGRYATAGAMADDLRRYLDHQPIQARPSGLLGLAAKWARRNRTAAALAVAAATVLTVIAVWHELTLRRHNESLASALWVVSQREQINRRLWYGSQVRLAQQGLAAGEVEFAQEALERLEPGPGERDLRGFEWHYLRRLARRNVSLLFGHSAAVDAIAVSPDGRTAASADATGVIILWDLVAARARVRMPGDGQGVRLLAFAPDGRALVSWDARNEVKIRDPATARETARVPGISGSVASIVFADNGRTLVVWETGFGPAGSDGKVTFWGVDPGPALAGSRAPSVESTAFAVSPGRRMLATASRSGHVTLRDASTGREVRSLVGVFPDLDKLGFTPDGRSVIVKDGAGISFHEVATGDEQGRLAPDSRDLPDLCVDMAQLFGLPLQSGRDLWLTVPGKNLCPTFLEDVPVKEPVHTRRFVFSFDGRTLAGVGHLQHAMIWDTQTGAKLTEYPMRVKGVNLLAFTQGGNSLVFGNEDARVRVWHVGKRHDPLGQLRGHDAEVWALAFSPDGTTLASAADDHSIRLWNPREGTLRATLTGHGSLVTSLAITPNGKTMASGGFDKTVRLWDLPSGNPRAVLRGHTDRVRGVSFSPDGRLLASCASDRTIRLWDAQDGRERGTLRGHAGGLHDLSFDSGGARLASAGNDRKLKVWDLANTHGPVELTSPGSVTALTFSQDGSLLVAGDDWGNMTVWDAVTWTIRTTVKGSDAPIWCLSFSPDGRTIAAACGDSKVRLWDPVTGQLTLVLDGHPQRVNAVAFSPDGKTLASASHDGAIKLWQTDAL